MAVVAQHARRSLRFGQLRTIALLFCGYAACYYCRADLSVATPLLAEELGKRGVSHADALLRIGSISTFGVVAYALGKFFLTGLGDYWGGRRNFLIGLGGATVFTLLFALGGALPLFTLAWVGNRLTQSIGWAGLVKVSSKWFDYSSYGLVLGILSVSYLIGDAVARAANGGVDRARLRLARAVRVRLAGRRRGARREPAVSARVARRGRSRGGPAQSAQPVRRLRVGAAERGGAAAATAAQPPLPAGLCPVVCLHDRA